jgi:2,4-dienoyl-CoA reductase-like NADH-dependent reductase (Old Yellow Enzyme family)
MKAEDKIRFRILACGNPFNRRGLIEISGGGVGRRSELRARAKSRDPELAEAYFAGHAEKIRDATKPTPLALVVGIRSRRTMEAIVGKGIADMVSMSRPFIREPSLGEGTGDQRHSHQPQMGDSKTIQPTYERLHKHR